MIDANKALASVEATPGDLVAIPKAQLTGLLKELRQLQQQVAQVGAHLAVFPVSAAVPA